MASYGHGELLAANETHLHWEWHQNQDLEPTVADELWIIKGQDTDDEPRTAQAVFRPGRGPAAAAVAAQQ